MLRGDSTYSQAAWESRALSKQRVGWMALRGQGLDCELNPPSAQEYGLNWAKLKL